jgi:hypothetical protein
LYKIETANRQDREFSARWPMGRLILAQPVREIGRAVDARTRKRREET